MEEIQTIEENVEVLVAGVSSINGETGDVSLKTINGESIIGEGDLPIAGTGTVKSVNDVEPDANGNVTLTASDVNAQTPLTAGDNITISEGTISATDTTYSAGAGLDLTGTQFSVDDTIATKTDLSSKQDSLSETQLNAVNSGIDSTKVGQIATNTSNITAIEGKIPNAASDQNQLADKSFVNSSVATNTANYISDNGEPFDSLADLEAYSGTLTNNDYAFVVGTDSAGNTTYTRYKYNATTGEWAEEYVLNNSSFTSTQWDAINSGITSGDVSKLTGLAEIKSIGTNLSLNSSTGELTATDTTYSAFVGTDGSTAGTAGLVPAPTTSDGGKYLKGDGTWGTVQAGPTVVQTTGTSQTNVMSQDATTKMIFRKRGQSYAWDPDNYKNYINIGGADEQTLSSLSWGINIGGVTREIADGSVVLSPDANTAPMNSVILGEIPSGSFASPYTIGIGNNTGANRGGVNYHYDGNIYIGYNARADVDPSQYWYRGSISLGAYSKTTQPGEMNIGSTNISYGYNSTNYRLLTGVHDGQSDHDAVNLGQLNGRVKQNAGAPTTSTVGTVGQLLEDTTNGKLYQCTAVDTTDPNAPVYTWEEVGGGAGPTVVQTTGTSTTDVMSQDAATKMIFQGNNKGRILIGGISVPSAGGVIIGQYASGTAQDCVALGSNTYAGGSSTSYGAVAIGGSSRATALASLAIGGGNGGNHKAQATGVGSIALGAGSSATAQGEMNIGTARTEVGYNSSNYRLLSGVYDGQGLHDAATVAQGNTLSTSAPTTSTVGVLGQLYTDTTNMHTYQCTAISGDTYTWTQRW